MLIILLTFSFAGCGSSQQTTPTNSGTNQTNEENEVVTGLIAKGKVMGEMSYEMSMTDSGINYQSKIWLKGTKMKTEATINNQKMISIIDSEKKEVITYIPEQKTASKIKLEEYQGKDDTSPGEYLGMTDNKQIKVTGTETVNGMQCKVIEITVDNAKVIKEWISTDLGLPVRIEQEIDGKKIVVDFKNYQVGSGTVSDDVFKLPADINVIDLNAMMNNLPKDGVSVKQ
jgi:hypothetical protein